MTRGICEAIVHSVRPAVEALDAAVGFAKHGEDFGMAKTIKGHAEALRKLLSDINRRYEDEVRPPEEYL